MGRIITELRAGNDAYLTGTSPGVNWVLLTDAHILDALSEADYAHLQSYQV